MSSKPCRDCGKPITWVERDGRNVSIDANGEDHWPRYCQSEKGRLARIRRMLEPGYFPVSPSAIDLYIDCPAAYKRRTIDHEPDIDIPAGEYGRRAHEWLAGHMRHQLGWDPEPPATPLIPKQFTEDWRWMKRAFERQVWDLSNLVGLEESLLTEWKDGEMTVQFKAIADMLTIADRRAAVTDWKSGWAIETPRALLDDIQAEANALVTFDNYGSAVDRVRFQQVQFRYGGQVVGVEYTDDDAEPEWNPQERTWTKGIAPFREWLRLQVRKMMTDTTFAPNPACQICPPTAHPSPALDPFRELHLETANGKMEVHLKRPETLDEAYRLATFHAALGRIYGAVADELRAWTDVAGPVPVGKRQFGPHVMKNRSIREIEKYIEILKEEGYGGQLAEYVKADGDKLRSTLSSKRDHVSLAMRIVEEGLIEETVSTKTEWHPIPEEDHLLETGQ